MSSPSGGRTSSGQSSCAANAIMTSEGPGSAVPAGPGSSPKTICQSRSRAMFRICTTRTASSTSAGGVPSAARTIGGSAANRSRRPSGNSCSSKPASAPVRT